MTYSDHPSFTPPDMTQYYRLQRMARLRESLARTIPDFSQKTADVYEMPQVKAFIKACPHIPRQAYGETWETVNPGVIPARVQLDNSIAGRKNLVRNLFEQLAGDTPAPEDRQAIESEIYDYCEKLGLETYRADNAINDVKKAVHRLKMGARLNLVVDNGPA